MIRQGINESVNRQRMGQASNEGMGDRTHVCTSRSIWLLTNQQINERMGQSAAHLLKRPLNIPTNGSTNEAVNARPRLLSTI